MPFQFHSLAIPDVILIETRQFDDDRGYFMESYKLSDFAENGLPQQFVQDNLSHSVHGVLRGLHYQIDPAAQGKLVTAVQGEIYDVAVDIRQGSPTFGQWVGETLSAGNGRLLYVPPGFAHGFCVLSQTATVLYKVTADYSSTCDRGIIWNDAAIGINWPIAEPILSAKDQKLPGLHKADNNFVYPTTP
ncbi:MAG: dTDP-4-dehydrorhamnose 3,5-epimerase [Chloroflexi bacterium]|nr:dTDP-4-dehydrorhamnose 3,5-epimerase [Chloroflexota bacterium]